MSSVEQSTGRASSATSGTALAELPPPKDERELLEREAALAREGMTLSLLDLKADAGELLDVAEWVREKPWWMLGASAGAGFLAARQLFSSDDGGDRDDLEPRRRRSKGGGFGALAALLAPIAAPIVSMAVAPLLRGMMNRDEEDSAFEKLTYGPLLTTLLKRLG